MMKSQAARTLLTALLVAVAVGAYFRIEGALPIAVTQTIKQATFDVTGQGKVVVKPDQAELSLGVNAEGPSVRVVTEQVDRQMEELTKRLKELEISEKDIKTVNYNVYQNYQPDGSRGNTYTVNSTVAVVVRELDKVSQVVDLIGELRLTQAGGLTFGLSDELMEKSRREARAQAIEKAKAKAKELSDLSGMKLGRIINVAEAEMGGMPVPMYAKAEVASLDSQTPAVMEPGTSEVSVSVTLSYESK